MVHFNHEPMRTSQGYGTACKLVNCMTQALIYASMHLHMPPCALVQVFNPAISQEQVFEDTKYLVQVGACAVGCGQSS